MIIKSKKEYYWHRYRLIAVPVACALIGMVAGILGRESAEFGKISGIAECPEIFNMIWKCIVFPVAVIILTKFVKTARTTVVSIMGTKIAMTVIGLAFGVNTNISLPLFHDDWGVLFFLAVDAFIIFAIYNANDVKFCVMGAAVLVTVLMTISYIIMLIEDGFEFRYLYRMVYIMMFYYPVWYVVNCTTRRWLPVPDPERWMKICSEEGN